MQLLKTTPNVFYEDLNVGINLFVHGLGFTIYHDERPEGNPFVVVARDNIKFHLHESAEWAAKDRPEFRIETDDIDALYAEVCERAPELIHPNGLGLSLRPWNAKEFALLDESKVCIILQQWM